MRVGQARKRDWGIYRVYRMGFRFPFKNLSGLLIPS
jgi:hypothetical protein